MKTGEVFDRGEDGLLYLCESFTDESTGVTYSTRTLVVEENNSGEE